MLLENTIQQKKKKIKIAISAKNSVVVQDFNNKNKVQAQNILQDGIQKNFRINEKKYLENYFFVKKNKNILTY